MMQMMRERETARVREIKNAPTCHQYVDACRLPSIHEETSYTVDCEKDDATYVVPSPYYYIDIQIYYHHTICIISYRIIMTYIFYTINREIR